MSRTPIVSTLCLLTTVFSFVTAQSHAPKTGPVKTAKSVLILKDTTSLETAVAQLVKANLTKKGFTVKEADIAGIAGEKASAYKISIVFSAVTTGENMDPRIDKFIASKGETSSVVKIFTVCGAVYDKKDAKVDAMTQASNALHPQMIADQILKSLKL